MTRRQKKKKKEKVENGPVRRGGGVGYVARHHPIKNVTLLFA